MKNIFLALILISIFSCETAQEKREKEFRDKIFASDYMLEQFKDYTSVSLNLVSAKNGHISQKQFIKDYNDKLAFALGYTNNLDSIESNLSKKSNLYQTYIVRMPFGGLRVTR